MSSNHVLRRTAHIRRNGFTTWCGIRDSKGDLYIPLRSVEHFKSRPDMYPRMCEDCLKAVVYWTGLLQRHAQDAIDRLHKAMNKDEVLGVIRSHAADLQEKEGVESTSPTIQALMFAVDFMESTTEEEI